MHARAFCWFETIAYNIDSVQVKLLQDAEDQPFWTVQVEGERGVVPRDCLLSTSGPRKGAWGDLA